MKNFKKTTLLILVLFFCNNIITIAWANNIDSESASGLELIFGQTSIAQNGFGCVPVSANNFADILSLQFTMEYDPSVLNFNAVVNLNPEVNDLMLTNFGMPNNIPEGNIAFNWFSIPMGSTLTDGAVLFEICFDAVGLEGSSTSLGINAIPDPPFPMLEASDINGQIVSVCSNPITLTIGPLCPIDSIANAGEYFGGLLNPLCLTENLTIQTVDYKEIDGCIDQAVSLDSMPIPDGTGIAATSSVIVNNFEAGTLIENETSIEVCIVIEHSYMRDLLISLQCPNGNEITLHEFPGLSGGQVFLGIPFELDEGTTSIPGQGWEYCWKMNADNGTWIEFADQNNPIGLPAGDYTPFDDFSNLVGCPANGAWTLSVEDLWGIDNGWLFSWDITIHQGNQYQQTYVFSNEADEIVSQTDESGFFDFYNNPIAAGNYEIYAFNYKLEDSIQQFNFLSELACDQDTDCCDLLLLTPISIDSCLCQNILLEVNMPDTLSLCGDAIEIAPQISFSSIGSSFEWEGAEPIDHNQPTIVELSVSGVIPNNLSANSIDKICIDSLRHTWDADLSIYLITPSNDTLELSTDNGANGDHYFNTCFSPTAIDSITLASPPFTGTYLPEGDFESIYGPNKPANGIWKLLLIDNYVGINGTIHKWSISFNEPSENLSYDWTPTTDLSCSDCPNPIASPTQTTTYTLSVSVEDTCSVVNAVTILVPDAATCVDDGDCTNGLEVWNTDSCECIVESTILGCTDSTALNFDPLAACDDGSCLFNNPCGNADSLQLVTFYNATGGDNWTNNTNWLQPGQPIENWFGVTTNAEGCVICIDLDGIANCLLDNNSAGNNLVGTLPPLDFPSLETLYLDNNLLSGCYPALVCFIDNASLAGNVQMPWFGDIDNFCEGLSQFDAPCDDGVGSADNDIINTDCECESVVGIATLSTDDFDVFPNPVSEQLFITTSQSTNYEVTLYNLLGQSVFEGLNTTVIDVKDLASGTYFLALVEQGQRRVLKKVVVE